MMHGYLDKHKYSLHSKWNTFRLVDRQLAKTEVLKGWEQLRHSNGAEWMEF